MGRTTPTGRTRCECILRQLTTISGMLWKMVFPLSHPHWTLPMWRDSSNSILKRRISYVAIWAKGSMEEWVLWKLLSLSGIGCPKSMKESQHSVTLELVFFAISSTASKDSTMKMSNKPLIASLTSQMSFKHLVPLTSPTMRWWRNCWDRLIPHLILWHWWYKSVLITSHLIPLISSRG